MCMTVKGKVKSRDRTMYKVFCGSLERGLRNYYNRLPTGYGTANIGDTITAEPRTMAPPRIGQSGVGVGFIHGFTHLKDALSFAKYRNTSVIVRCRATSNHMWYGPGILYYSNRCARSVRLEAVVARFDVFTNRWVRVHNSRTKKINKKG